MIPCGASIHCLMCLGSHIPVRAEKAREQYERIAVGGPHCPDGAAGICRDVRITIVERSLK